MTPDQFNQLRLGIGWGFPMTWLLIMILGLLIEGLKSYGQQRADEAFKEKAALEKRVKELEKACGYALAYFEGRLAPESNIPTYILAKVLRSSGEGGK